MANKPKELSEKDYLREIGQKLDRLTGIVATQGKPLATQIKILTSLGLSSSAIGAILDKSPYYVRELRSKRRKRSKNTKKRK